MQTKNQTKGTASWLTPRGSNATASVIIGVGTALMLTWIRALCFKGTGFFANQIYGGFPAYVYAIGGVTASLAFLFFAFTAERFALRTRTRRFAFSCALCTSATAVAYLVLWVLDGWNPFTIALVGICAGLFPSALIVFFGGVIARFEIREVIIAMATCLVATSLIFAGTSYLGSFSPFAPVIFTIVEPLLAFICLDAGRQGTLDQPSPKPVKPSFTWEASRKERRDTAASLYLRITVCSLIIGFCMELPKSGLASLGLDESAPGWAVALHQGSASVIIVVVVLVLLISFITTSSSDTVRRAWSLTTMLLIVSALCVPLPFIFPIDPTIPMVLSYASNQCFIFFAWTLTLCIAHRHLELSYSGIPFVFAGWSAGPLIGAAVGGAVGTSAGYSIETMYLIVFVAVVLIEASSLLVFTERASAAALDLLPTANRKRFQEKCKRAAQVYGLTPREEEIMTLFAKGRDLAYISNSLCVSKATVSTHRQHIYRKMGIHTHQELLDKVEAC